MSAPVPDAATLLQAAADYLEGALLPTLDGYHRFQTRVTVNALRIVMRELQLAPAQRADEHARLAALLGHDGDTAALEAELAAALVDGQRPPDDPSLIDHLRRTLRDALAIHNPKWAADAAPDNPRTAP
jgi:hypothetical protein